MGRAAVVPEVACAVWAAGAGPIHTGSDPALTGPVTGTFVTLDGVLTDRCLAAALANAALEDTGVAAAEAFADAFVEAVAEAEARGVAAAAGFAWRATTFVPAAGHCGACG